MSKQTVAVVLAGGRGRRVGADRNKVLVDVAGRPVITWAVAAFTGHAAIDRVVLVGHRDDLEELRRITVDLGAVDLIEGGAERPDSERAALELLRPDVERGIVGAVLIHDGARPCVTPSLIDAAVRAAQTEGVVPTLEAPPLVRDDRRRITPAPGHLMRAQTPQGGPAPWLLAAYDGAQRTGFAGTDTASFLEHAGRPVRAIAGEATNLKVTYPDDLAAAGGLLRAGG